MNKFQLYARQNIFKLTGNDINHHTALLIACAAGCAHVTEFGTRNGHSTAAFLAACPDKLVCYDLSFERLDRQTFQDVADQEGVDFELIEADTSTVRIADTDLLFIDTLHTYQQVQAELSNNHAVVHRFIILHDTEKYGFQGEQGQPGIRCAINEFLEAHTEWAIIFDLKTQNGMMFLERKPE